MMNLEVLLVEDDEILVIIHENWVQKSGISNHPLTFLNGKLAWDYLLENQAKDKHYLILLDINMPIMSGWELLDKLNNLSFSEQIYVVMVSSSTSLKDKEKALTYKNVIDFIEKPINLERCNRIKALPQIKPFY